MRAVLDNGGWDDEIALATALEAMGVTSSPRPAADVRAIERAAYERCFEAISALQSYRPGDTAHNRAIGEALAAIRSLTPLPDAARAGGER